jgi:Na+:H+ antiporter, NhaC family
LSGRACSSGFSGPLIAAASGALVATLVAAAFGTNVLASDQYVAVVLPGRMFRGAFESRGLAPAMLFRGLGDSAAVTSPLVPWNRCGAYMVATLGVATTAYLPFAFFNLINPLVAIAFGFIVLRVLRARVADPENETTGRIDDHQS